MSETQAESVRKLLGDLHAWRLENMDPATLKLNIDQRALLVDTADASKFIKAGDTVEPFDLPDVDGGRVTLDTLLAAGPAVLVFFRFAGCPACNIAIPFYQRQLYPHLAQFGATLVAISPQVPEKLLEIKTKHNLEFLVASDVGNELGRKFGILFESDEPSKKAALARGAFIGDLTGTGTWELPMPTVVVIDQNRKVRFAEVTPDWMARTEASSILEVLRDLALDNAA